MKMVDMRREKYSGAFRLIGVSLAVLTVALFILSNDNKSEAANLVSGAAGDSLGLNAVQSGNQPKISLAGKKSSPARTAKLLSLSGL